MTLIRLIVDRGADAVNALPEGIRKNREPVAENIENNVRRSIIDEQPVNPKYYEKMSELLDALKVFVQPANHFEGQRPVSTHDFVDTSSAPDDADQRGIAGALLLQPESREPTLQGMYTF